MADRITRVMLMLIAATAIGLALLVAARAGFRLHGALAVGLVVMPVVLAVAALASLWLSVANRISLLITVGSVVVALYGFELFLRWQTAQAVAAADAAIARKAGGAVDKRTPPQVIADLRAAGQDAYPAYAVKVLAMPMAIDGQSVMPISSISRALTVHCNESGQYRLYTSDRYGFANPDALWDQRNPAVAIGDSFVHGSCVDKGLVDGLRRTLPGTLNLGYGGLGPLVELGVLREYAASRRPPLVLWFYYENDLNNLLIEMRNPVYRQWLEPGRTLGLMAKQPAIDAAVKTFMAESFAARLERVESGKGALEDIVMLRDVRQRLGLRVAGEVDEPRTAPEWRAALPGLEQVMGQARDTVAGWGGRLVFVYLPSINHVMPAGARSPEVELHPEIVERVSRLGLPVLDLVPAFAAEKDAADRFWHYPGSHYNEAGYAFAAEQVGTWLKNEGYVR